MELTITEWIMTVGILVALFGGQIWKWIANIFKRSRINSTIKQHLVLLLKDLLKHKEDSGVIEISETTFSEIGGYYFLFEDLVLKNIDVFDVSKYPALIEFFMHYKINMTTINTRFTDKADKQEQFSHITKNTYNLLIERLDNAISELSRD